MNSSDLGSIEDYKKLSTGNSQSQAGTPDTPTRGLPEGRSLQGRSPSQPHSHSGNSRVHILPTAFTRKPDNCPAHWRSVLIGHWLVPSKSIAHRITSGNPPLDGSPAKPGSLGGRRGTQKSQPDHISVNILRIAELELVKERDRIRVRTADQMPSEIRSFPVKNRVSVAAMTVKGFAAWHPCFDQSV